MDLDPEVVDEVGMVDGLEYPQLVRDIPGQVLIVDPSRVELIHVNCVDFRTLDYETQKEALLRRITMSFQYHTYIHVLFTVLISPSFIHTYIRLSNYPLINIFINSTVHSPIHWRSYLRVL